MRGKNKLPKQQVTQSKKLKNYRSDKEICPSGIKDSPCYYLVMADFYLQHYKKKKKRRHGECFFVTKNNIKKFKIYLAILNTEDCKCLS